MGDKQPVFRSAFQSADDENNTSLGIKPVIFDILGPDQETSLLPDYMKMVLHVNPSTMTVNYSKIIERIQTKGGFVEQHWGEGLDTLDFNMATGGFMRLFSGLSNITGGPGSLDVQGNRRETISYDKYLDFLALFHNNGSVYDITGKIVFQGVVKVTFDGGVYFGVFNDLNVDETAEKPYQFTLSSTFTIQREILRIRTVPNWNPDVGSYWQENQTPDWVPDLFDPNRLNQGQRVE